MTTMQIPVSRTNNIFLAYVYHITIKWLLVASYFMNVWDKEAATFDVSFCQQK